jgi:hypothetical protein
MKYNPITVLRMREYGESVLSNLASNDARVSGSLRVGHTDGSTSIIACAYAEVVGDWVMAFSLIDGFVLFHKDGVKSWQQQSAFALTSLACEPAARSELVRLPRNVAA